MVMLHYLYKIFSRITYWNINFVIAPHMLHTCKMLLLNLGHKRMTCNKVMVYFLMKDHLV